MEKVDAIASAQHGVVTTRQLLDAGASSAGISRATGRGRLVRVHRSVYRVAGAPATWRQAVMAAVLAGAPHAFASHRTGIALSGLPRTRGGIVEIVSEQHQRLQGSQVVSHRTLDLAVGDQWRVDGIPVTGIDRSLIDVGRYWPPSRVGSLLDEAVRARLTTYERFVSRVHALARPGRNGIGVARQVLADRGMDDGWAFEKAMRRALRRHGLPAPTREWPVETPVKRYFVDFGYPAANLGIECDSSMWHTLPYQFEADLVRQNAIVGEGVLLLRYTPSRLRDDEDAVIAEISRHLELRS